LRVKPGQDNKREKSEREEAGKSASVDERKVLGEKT